MLDLDELLSLYFSDISSMKMTKAKKTSWELSDRRCLRFPHFPFSIHDHGCTFHDKAKQNFCHKALELILIYSQKKLP